MSNVDSITLKANGTIATNGGAITTSNGSINTGSGSITTTGSISAATSLNTINGVIINAGAVSNVTSITASGQITAGSFNSGSDYRIKKNIQPLNEMITIDNLKPIEYDLSGGSHDMGFLAHEVQEIFPFLVTGEKDGEKIQTLNYNGFIALLVKEVQDLKSENRELKERMDRLEKYFM